jgi:hypothetical protein
MTYEQARRAKFWYCQPCEDASESESEDDKDAKKQEALLLLERGDRSRRPSQRYKEGDFVTVDNDLDEARNKAIASVKSKKGGAKVSVVKGSKREREDSDDSSSDDDDELMMRFVLFFPLSRRTEIAV